MNIITTSISKSNIPVCVSCVTKYNINNIEAGATVVILVLYPRQAIYLADFFSKSGYYFIITISVSVDVIIIIGAEEFFCSIYFTSFYIILGIDAINDSVMPCITTDANISPKSTCFPQ